MHFIKTAHLGSQRRNYRALTDKGNGSVVSQDREKGVVILGGHVAAEADKVQAESLAKSIAVAQVVANQIAVTPPGVGSEAKTGNSGPRGRTLALYRDDRRRDAVIFDQFES
jgi:osmotically-inducible protein OsmY